MRYVSRPKTYWDAELEQEVVSPTTLTVHEDHEPEFTGLLDKQGNPIYRVRDVSPIGFRSKPCL